MNAARARQRPKLKTQQPEMKKKRLGTGVDFSCYFFSVSTILTRIQEKDSMSLPVKKRDEVTLGILYNSAARSKGPSSSEGPAPEGRKEGEMGSKREKKRVEIHSSLFSLSVSLGNFRRFFARERFPPSSSLLLHRPQFSL